MKLGFLTACLPNVRLGDLIKWAKEYNFNMLEVACWPIDNARDYSGSSIEVDSLNRDKANKIREIFKINSVEISSLAYYDNNLDPNPEGRKKKLAHLRKVIDAANLLGVNLVGSFIGRDPHKTIKENFEEVKKVFPDILKYALDKGVRLMIENCPMENWQFEGLIGNIAYNPETWNQLFEIIPEKGFGLNFDPSHLYWQQIDYLSCIRQFKERIFHVHAKDTEIIHKGLSQDGIFGSGWWRYRLPGLGKINWSEFISVLKENDYDGVLSIEHEDPVWRGSEDKVKKGLSLGQRYLSQLI